MYKLDLHLSTINSITNTIVYLDTLSVGGGSGRSHPGIPALKTVFFISCLFLSKLPILNMLSNYIHSISDIFIHLHIHSLS
jgi:hypothetical protein